MLQLRKILFYLFAIFYVVLCPIIILDALGIIITPGRQKMMSATGLISVSTIPQGADISINGKRTGKKSPALLRDLHPGLYDVSISLSGHKTWNKKLSVQKSEAVALENILLIPELWETQIISNQRFDRLIPTENNTFFMLTQGPALKDLRIYRYKENLIEQASSFTNSSLPHAQNLESPFASDPVYADARFLSVKTMPHSATIFLSCVLQSMPLYLLGRVNSGSLQLEDISSVIDNNLEDIQWDENDKNLIFYSPTKGLYWFNRAEKQPQLITEATKGYSLFDHSALVVTADNQFLRFNDPRAEKEPLTGTLPQLPAEFRTAEKFIVHPFSENLILFLSQTGSLLSNKVPYLFASEGIRGFSHELSHNRIIVWTKNKLGMIDFTKTSTEGIFETGPAINWLSVGGKDIQQATWVNKGTHIFYRDRDQIKITESEMADKPFIGDVVRTNDDFLYDNDTGLVYYIDDKTRQFMATTILPRHEFIVFKIPEYLHKGENLP